MTKKLFYHYTQFRRLERILEEGIRSVPDEERNWRGKDYVPHDNVVWLTAAKSNPHAYFLMICEARITVRLSPSKRLHNWATWLRKHMPDVFTARNSGEVRDDPTWKSFWFYEATITPNKFEAVEDNDWWRGWRGLARRVGKNKWRLTEAGRRAVRPQPLPGDEWADRPLPLPGDEWAE
jgi:hypothetical protein